MNDQPWSRDDRNHVLQAKLETIIFHNNYGHGKEFIRYAVHGISVEIHTFKPDFFVVRCQYVDTQHPGSYSWGIRAVTLGITRDELLSYSSAAGFLAYIENVGRVAAFPWFNSKLHRLLNE